MWSITTPNAPPSPDPSPSPVEKPTRVIAVEMRQGDDVHFVKVNACNVGVALPDIGKAGIKQHLFAPMCYQRAKPPFRLPAHIGGEVFAQQPDLH